MMSVYIGGNHRDMCSFFIFETETDLCADDRICIRYITEISLPLLFPRLLTLHRIRMRYISYIRSVNRSNSYRSQIICPIESCAKADSVRVIYTNRINDLFLNSFPFLPCAFSGIRTSDCRLIVQLIQCYSRFISIPLGNCTPEFECLLKISVVHLIRELCILQVTD